jgi:hypothetical protein
MTARNMAAVAHARHTHLEQLRIVCSMRFVAVRTILHHGRVFPKEWSTTLRMAAHAVLGYCWLNQLLGIGTAMWVMTSGAGHLALSVRHVG